MGLLHEVVASSARTLGELACTALAGGLHLLRAVFVHGAKQHASAELGTRLLHKLAIMPPELDSSRSPDTALQSVTRLLLALLAALVAPEGPRARPAGSPSSAAEEVLRVTSATQV